MPPGIRHPPPVTETEQPHFLDGRHPCCPVCWHKYGKFMTFIPRDPISHPCVCPCGYVFPEWVQDYKSAERDGRARYELRDIDEVVQSCPHCDKSVERGPGLIVCAACGTIHYNGAEI